MPTAQRWTATPVIDCEKHFVCVFFLFSCDWAKMSLGRSMSPSLVWLIRNLNLVDWTKYCHKYTRTHVRAIEFIFMPAMAPLLLLLLPAAVAAFAIFVVFQCVLWFVTLVQVTVNLLSILFFSCHRTQFVLFCLCFLAEFVNHQPKIVARENVGHFILIAIQFSVRQYLYTIEIRNDRYILFVNNMRYSKPSKTSKKWFFYFIVVWMWIKRFVCYV